MTKKRYVDYAFLDGSDVWRGIDVLPKMRTTILVEKQLKGSDILVYRTEDVCVERNDRFEPTMSFVPKRWAYVLDLAQCKRADY